MVGISDRRGRALTRRLVIVDPNLIDERGNHLGLTRRFAAAALARGDAVTILAHETVDAAKLDPAATVIGCFAETSYDPMADGDRRRDLAPRIADTLNRALAQPDLKGARLLVHSADGHSLRAMATVLPATIARGAVVHLVTSYAPATMPGGRAGPGVDEAIRRLAHHASTGRSLFLWAETAPLAAFYSAAYGTQCAWLPLPSPEWAASLPTPTGPLTLAFLGSAREEKGFARLPEIVAQLGNAAAQAVRFEIQAYAPASGLSAACERAMADLAGWQDVRLHSGTLSENAYAALIGRADVLMLPYAPANYRLRGSGIAVEALSAGRAILASTGTEAAEMAPLDLRLAAPDIAGWATLVQQLAADLPSRRARMAVAGAAFRQGRSASAALDRLVARETVGQLLATEGAGAAPLLGLIDLSRR